MRIYILDIFLTILYIIFLFYDLFNIYVSLIYNLLIDYLVNNMLILYFIIHYLFRIYIYLIFLR